MPKIQALAKRVRIYIGEEDRWNGKSLYHALVEKQRNLISQGRRSFAG
jgi:hypothetical protein